MYRSALRRRGRLAVAIHSSLPDRAGLFVLVGATLGFALHAPAASASPIVVDTTGDPGPGGTTSLRQAVFEANGLPNSVIAFDPSLNGSTITLTQGEIAINEPMYISGPGADQLTISGNDAYRIFDISTAPNAPISVTVSGLTLAHGMTGGGGGAIYASYVSLTVQDSVVEYSTAYIGGAVYSAGGSGLASACRVLRTTIRKNSAHYAAGIAFADGASIDVSDSTISSNTASRAAGGALLRGVPSITIERSQVSGNRANLLSGGGLEIYAPGGVSSVSQISNSAFSGNYAKNDGGGLSLFDAAATLTHVTVSGNSAYSGGGIFALDTRVTVTTELTLDRSTISGNTAAHFGGGIDAARVYYFGLRRSLVSGNSAYDPNAGGGGIAIQSAQLTSFIGDSTVYGNYAYNNGGGIGIFDTGGDTQLNGVTIADNLTFNYASNGMLGNGTTSLYNCILANSSSHSSNQDLYGSFSETDSLIRNPGTASLVGFDNKNGVDPQLGPLAVNGGPTLTMLPAVTSPALDAGGPSLSGTDQRGLPRNVNGRRDMGAVERQYPEDVIFRDGFNSS